jgi:hypothetical protein
MSGGELGWEQGERGPHQCGEQSWHEESPLASWIFSIAKSLVSVYQKNTYNTLDRCPVIAAIGSGCRAANALRVWRV